MSHVADHRIEKFISILQLANLISPGSVSLMLSYEWSTINEEKWKVTCKRSEFNKRYRFEYQAGDTCLQPRMGNFDLNQRS